MKDCGLAATKHRHPREVQIFPVAPLIKIMWPTFQCIFSAFDLPSIYSLVS